MKQTVYEGILFGGGGWGSQHKRYIIVSEVVIFAPWVD
jgi:hypothetical protein